MQLVKNPDLQDCLIQIVQFFVDLPYGTDIPRQAIDEVLGEVGCAHRAYLLSRARAILLEEYQRTIVPNRHTRGLRIPHPHEMPFVAYTHQRKAQTQIGKSLLTLQATALDGLTPEQQHEHHARVVHDLQIQSLLKRVKRPKIG